MTSAQQSETAVRACLTWADDLDSLPNFGPVFDVHALATFWRYVSAVIQNDGPLDEVSIEALRQARPIVVAMGAGPDPDHIMGAAALLAVLDTRLGTDPGLGL